MIGFGFNTYLTVFDGMSSYAKTYGAVAGVIVALFLIWLLNVMLLFGAVLDAERIAVIPASEPEPPEADQS